MLALAALVGCSEYEYIERGHVDLLTQGGEQARTDIVFVVDDSASMAEEQAQLAVAFEGFTDVLLDTEADFQLAVTTTDPGDADVLAGPVLDEDTPELAAALLEQLAVGTSGTRDEQGFERAVQAVTAGGGLIVRPDARLVTLFFSDEDDHSLGTVEGWMDELELRSGAGAVSHAIVGDLPGGCASGQSAADAGPRYIEAAELTGGLTGSICSDDYAHLFEEVGFAVLGWNDTFPLSNLPEPDTLTVRVDDVLMPARDVDGWVYSLGDNAVVFSGRAIPRPGMRVELRYELAEGDLVAVDDDGAE